jgi:hypothetical protein
MIESNHIPNVGFSRLFLNMVSSDQSHHADCKWPFGPLPLLFIDWLRMATPWVTGWFESGYPIGHRLVWEWLPLGSQAGLRMATPWVTGWFESGYPIGHRLVWEWLPLGWFESGYPIGHRLVWEWLPHSQAGLRVATPWVTGWFSGGHETLHRTNQQNTTHTYVTKRPCLPFTNLLLLKKG